MMFFLQIRFLLKESKRKFNHGNTASSRIFNITRVIYSFDLPLEIKVSSGSKTTSMKNLFKSVVRNKSNIYSRLFYASSKEENSDSVIINFLCPTLFVQLENIDLI